MRIGFLAAALAAMFAGQALAATPAAVDSPRLAGGAREPDQWFTPGRDIAGTYYSPLDDINDGNVERLGFAWDYHFGTRRGLEATPVVVDGVMYTSGNWGRVYALDAASGRELWTYDPGGRRSVGPLCLLRCRQPRPGGVEGPGLRRQRRRLSARDRRAHRPADLEGRHACRSAGPRSFHYFVTGAPLLAGDVIVIGNGGADFKGARGSVSAYDSHTGAFRWRFYTVPRDPKLGPQDQPHLAGGREDLGPRTTTGATAAAGPPGTDSPTIPSCDSSTVGTGNASPYHGQHDPAGSGDELYVASIIAVHADTGDMAWYYQEMPGEGWDYDTTNKMVLADLPVGGAHAQGHHAGAARTASSMCWIAPRASFCRASRSPRELDQGARPRKRIGRSGSPPRIGIGQAGADCIPRRWAPTAGSRCPSARRPGWCTSPSSMRRWSIVDTSKRRAGLIEGNFDLAFFPSGGLRPEGARKPVRPLAVAGSRSPGAARRRSRKRPHPRNASR